jgi:DNA polymerase III subunit alpha
MIAYQTAYLKAHYPVEFMAALLTSDINNLDRIGIEIAECKEMGIEVLPPDVNESFVDFGTVFYPDPAGKRQDSYIRFGLGAIKNVGIQPAEAIVEERKAGGQFANFADFLRRNCSHLNKKVLENLAMAGALDSLSERQLVLSNLELIVKFLGYIRGQKGSNQASLFDGVEEDSETYHLELAPSQPADQKTRLTWERELLGIYLSSHPIAPYAHCLPEDRTQIIALPELPNNTVVRVCGIVMTYRKILTKSGSNMAFVGLEDETGFTEVIVFPKTFEGKEELLQSPHCGGQGEP